MLTLSFFVKGIPKGQPRPRAFFNKHTGRASVFDGGTAEWWKSQIAVALDGAVRKHFFTEKSAAECYPVFEGDTPLEVTLQFYFPRPKAHFKRDGSLKDNVPNYYIKKPDNDNLEKAVFDALTQTGLWKDDAIIAKNKTSKRYEMPLLHSGCVITIKELEDK